MPARGPPPIAWPSCSASREASALRTAATSPRPAIRFVRAATGKAESHALEIGANGATITAGDDAGLLYGAVTLRQVLTQDGGKGAVTTAGLSIHDAPRFAGAG